MNHFPKTKHWTALVFLLLGLCAYAQQYQGFTEAQSRGIITSMTIPPQQATSITAAPNFSENNRDYVAAPSHFAPIAEADIGHQSHMCPELTFEFNVPTPICRNTENDSVFLAVTVTGGTGTGTGTWFGQGIIDPINGIFSPLFVNPGSVMISYLYTEDDCQYTATVTLQVVSTALIGFNVENNVNCQLDTVKAFLTAPLAPGVNPVWDLNGGQIIGGNQPDTILVKWSEPGNKWIQLQAEQNGCLSNPFPIPIRLDPPIDTPMVACDPTNDRVEFSWQEAQNGQSFVIFVVKGPNGFITSDSSYAIENLQPGQEVIIRLATISQNTCPGNIQDLGCESLLCPIIEMSIDSIPPICLLNNQPQTVPIGLTLVDDSPGGGVVSWHGAGIADTLIGEVTIDPTMVGVLNKIYVNYTNAFCTYTDSTTFQVLTESEANFSIPTSFCFGDTATVFFTGSATDNAELRWDFDGGTILSGSGLAADPYLITWPTEGQFTTQLELIDPGCGNDFSSQVINIAAPLPQTVIECAPGLDSVLFTWTPVPGSSGFEVNILEGPEGVLLDEGHYLFQNLAPSTPVRIEVVYSSADCDGSRTQMGCSSLDCPAVNMTFVPMAPQCFVANQMDTIPLNILIDVPGGALQLSGSGIYDPNIPAVVINQNMVNQQNKVVATYLFGGCEYVDSISYEVFQTPVANFDLPASSCADESVLLSFTGSAPVDATLVWEFGGATILDNQDERLITLSWPDGGTKTINLFVASNGCFSETIEQQIDISEPVAPPVINCTSGLDEVTFTWDEIPGLSPAQVTVTNGPTGTLLNANTYQISGLMPNQTVEIALLFGSTTNCPDSTVTATCMTLGCPDSGITIDPVSPICYLGPETLSLSFTPDPALTGGTPSWRGPGIIDGINGLWQLDQNAIGRNNQIILDYSTGLCSYSDTIQIEVKPSPVATFDLPGQLCPDEAAQVVFTGNATAAAVYNWDFGGGVATPGTGPGPHEVNWNGAGTFEVSLSIEDNGCLSGTSRVSTTILAPFSTPVVACNSDLTSMTFSWNPVAGAASYDIVLSPVGLSGVFLDATTYQISNLAPSTSVDFQLTAVDPQGCRDVQVSQSCSTSACPSVTLNWETTTAICLGDQTVITFLLDAPVVQAVDLTVNFGGNTITLTGIRNGDELPVDITETTTFTITQASIPGFEVCPLDIPSPITITVNQPLSAGVGTDPAALCSSEDRVFDLFALLSGENVGGNWTETSATAAIGGAFNASNGSFTINNQLSGTYTFAYTLTAAAPCPSDTSHLSITVNSAPVADAGPDIYLDCFTNVASLGGDLTSSGMLYEWVSAAGVISNSPMIEVEAAGNYILRVTNPTNGCSIQDVANVSTYDDFFVPYVSVSSITCFGENDGYLLIDSIQGTATNIQSALNGGTFSNAKVYGPLGPGVYEMVFSDDKGCEQRLQFILDAPEEVNVSLQAKLEGTDQVINLGDSVLLEAQVNIPKDAISSVVWTPALPGTADQFKVLVKPEFSTSFSVTVTDENGCEATDRFDLLVNRDIHVYMANVFRPGPNGTNSLFMVQSGSQINMVNRFLIFDRWGNILFERTNFPPNDPSYAWDGTYKNQLLNAGVYVYWLDVETVTGEVRTLKGDVALIR